MGDKVEYRTLHEERVHLVAEALRKHSDIDEKDVVELAEHVLYVIDHVPEKIR